VKAFAAGSGGGWHKPVRSDCLLKTQVRAKSQDDVYGLTPARCWKVKRTGVNGGGNYNHPKVAKFLVG